MKCLPSDSTAMNRAARQKRRWSGEADAVAIPVTPRKVGRHLGRRGTPPRFGHASSQKGAKSGK